MAEQSGLEADIALFTGLLNGPDKGLAEFMANQPNFRTPDDGRRLVADILVGLEDVDAGRTVPHAEIVRDMEERQRQYRMRAAG
ncbi:MAG TPA: hypothetical protein VF592_04365 [Sphingomonas sp.]|jgi:hypothetical protein|uniref:hypothetical protein n=1 Tax=Sphingomonas sp. TaxID=28214 RepID=UPI002ED77618